MKRFLVLFLFCLLVSACNPAAAPTTPSPSIAASTVPPIVPTETSTPSPAFTSTPVLFEGTLTIKVNIRSGPGTGFESLGQLDAGATVKILFRNEDSSWYQVLFPSAPQGFGWVAAQFVNLPTGTSIPMETTTAGPVGILTQPVNVRTGPGVSFDTLSVLPAGSSVLLTGKNRTASWYQVSYPPGTIDHGWVTSQYVQTDASDSLPILDDFGNLISELGGTPTGPYISPTPTTGPASQDSDSASQPAVRVVFSGNGTDRFIYSSQVSSPEGDQEDWVEFTPYAPGHQEAMLYFSLSCSGGSSLKVELYQGNSRLSGWGSLSCNTERIPVQLSSDQPFQLRIVADGGDQLTLVAYTLTVQNLY